MSTPAEKPKVHHSELIAEALDYCAKAAISPSTFGHKTVNDGQFLSRLQAGGRCWPETEAKVREFIRQNPPKSSGEPLAEAS